MKSQKAVILPLVLLTGRNSRRDFWALAAEELVKDDDSTVDCLENVRAAAKLNDSSLAEKLIEETERSKSQLCNKQWKLQIAGKEFMIRDQLDKIIKFAKAFKDVATPAAGLDPIHAGLPLAGLFLIMQFVSTDGEQFTSIITGVEEVTEVIRRYKLSEWVYNHRPNGSLKSGFDIQRIELYKCILKYLVSAIAYYQRNTGLRFLRAIPKLDDLSDILAKIRRKDAAWTQLEQQFDSQDDQLRHQEILLHFKDGDEHLSKISQDLQLLTPSSVHIREAAPELSFAFIRDPKFTGRQDTISDLDAGFKTNRRLALVGWAGVGKSQIAIEYAHILIERKSCDKILWVRGARRDVFLKSYLGFCQKLKLPGWDDPKTNFGKLFSSWLSDSTNGSWLMVLDNVDDERVFSQPIEQDIDKQSQGPSESLESYLPNVSHGSILITSRNKTAAWALANEDDCILLIDRLPPKVALSLLYKKLPKDLSPHCDAEELTKHLENLPIAITQAAAYISKRSPWMTISRYLELLKSDEIRYLEESARDIRRDSSELGEEFSDSVLKTCFISFKYIDEKHAVAAECLRYMSLVFCEGIPVEMALQGQVDSFAIHDSIGRLIEFSLIKPKVGDKTFSIHRLVQLSVQSWLKTNNRLQEYQQRVQCLFCGLFPWQPADNWSTSDLLMPHLEVVAEYGHTTASGLKHRISFTTRAAGYYLWRGDYGPALERALRACQLCSDNSCCISIEIQGAAEIMLITIQTEMGQTKPAQLLAQSLVKRSTVHFGKMHERTRIANLMLAEVLLARNEKDEAYALLKPFSQIWKRRIRTKSGRVAHLTPSLSKSSIKGKHRGAMRKDHKATLGMDTTSLQDCEYEKLSAIVDHSCLLVRTRRRKEAESLLRTVRCDFQHLLRKDSLVVIGTLVQYVDVLSQCRKYQEGTEWNDLSLRMMKRLAIPDSDSRYHEALHLKASLESYQGEFQKSRETYKTLAVLMETQLGDSHIRTLMSMYDLAKIEMALEDYLAAEYWLEKVANKSSLKFGHEHAFTVKVLADCAKNRQMISRKKENEDLRKGNEDHEKENEDLEKENEDIKKEVKARYEGLREILRKTQKGMEIQHGAQESSNALQEPEKDCLPLPIGES